MKGLRISLVLGLIVLSVGYAVAQRSKKEVVSFYKYQFLIACTELLAIDTGWRDDLCVWIFDGQNILDKRSYLEIDSMSSVVEEIIWKDFDETTGHPRYPNSLVARECVIKHCLDQYESKDLDRVAKRAARRVRKMTAEEIFMSHQ